MPPRKELCRNFQRGSCQYGDRCIFLHATSQSPQQSRTSPSGFGAQTSTPFQHTNQQQQAPNPFGFGAKNNNSQPRGSSDFGSKPTQFKPFENKWSRFSPINGGSVPASRQPNSQPQAANHKCTNPESCKQIILEDLENEKPVWKLTCYGHNRDGPCDIVGDISCEELRALAYEEAKQGKSLQFIIERERSLLNSKLVEFQNLVQKPYTVSSDAAALSNQNPFAASHSNSTTNNGVTPPVSSFTQLGASLNTGSAALSTQNLFAGALSNSITNNGVAPAVSSFSQLGASLNTRPAAAPTYTFGQASVVQNNTNPSSLFQTNNSSSNVSGAFGSLISQKSVQSSSSFGSANSGNSMASVNKNPFSSFANSSQVGSAAGNQLGFGSNLSPSASTFVESSSINSNLTDNLPKEDSNMDDSIWTKKEWKWNKGEIPELPPPDIYIR